MTPILKTIHILSIKKTWKGSIKKKTPYHAVALTREQYGEDSSRPAYKRAAINFLISKFAEDKNGIEETQRKFSHKKEIQLRMKIRDESYIDSI